MGFKKSGQPQIPQISQKDIITTNGPDHTHQRQERAGRVCTEQGQDGLGTQGRDALATAAAPALPFFRLLSFLSALTWLGYGWRGFTTEGQGLPATGLNRLFVFHFRWSLLAAGPPLVPGSSRRFPGT